MLTEQNLETIEIRPFRDEDRAPILAIINRDAPPHWYYPLPAWEQSDARRPADEVFLRLSIGDPAIATMEVTDFSTTVPKKAHTCAFSITVAHMHRRRGLGSALYEKVLAFAQEHGAKRLTCDVLAWTADEPGIAFLEKRGFSEWEREQAAYLDLTTFDPARFQPALERVARADIRIVTFAEAGDTEEHRLRLYVLFIALHREVPRRDQDPYTPRTFDAWWQRYFQRPEYTPSLIRLAAAGGKWVGLTIIMPKEECKGAMQWLTGVLPAYRNRGIATALKVDSYIAAKALGMTDIITENHEDNGPMLTVNKTLGFVPDAPLLSYHKVL